MYKRQVQIVLNNASLTNETSAALYVREADKVFLTTAPDSENSLSSGDSYVAIDDNNIDAAVFSKSDLTLNGSGTPVSYTHLPGTLFFPDGAGEFHGSFAVNGGDPSGVGGQDYPFFIELDGEIAGFIGEFRRELPDLVRFAGNPSLQDKILGFGEDTAVILQNGEGEIGIVGEVLPCLLYTSVVLDLFSLAQSTQAAADDGGLHAGTGSVQRSRYTCRSVSDDDDIAHKSVPFLVLIVLYRSREDSFRDRCV